jgi:hypothetical protein
MRSLTAGRTGMVTRRPFGMTGVLAAHNPMTGVLPPVILPSREPVHGLMQTAGPPERSDGDEATDALVDGRMS